MSDLEEIGLIFAPHTSAGRLPTELGLRFFVDALMQIGDLTEDNRRSIEAQVAGAGANKSVEVGFDRGLANAVGPDTVGRRGADFAKTNVRLKHIEFIRLEPERALAVLVAEDGPVENRVLNVPGGLPSSALVEAGNFLNSRIRGKTLAELHTEIEKRGDARQGRTRPIDSEDHLRRTGELVRRRYRPAPVDRARPRQSARRSACARRSRAGAGGRCSMRWKPSVA